MQRVVGGTEARAHAWPSQVGPSQGQPVNPMGVLTHQDHTVRPPPCFASSPPSPDLPPVLLQWQLASHLRRVPHPEKLGDDSSPLRG